MKKSKSLRSQLTIFMAILVAFQSVALISSLVISQVFSLLDAESFRLFDNTASSRSEEYNKSMATIVSNAALEAEYLNEQLQRLARSSNTNVQELWQSDAVYKQATRQTLDAVLEFLGSNRSTGAFVILNGANEAKDDPLQHSAVYIRNSSPSVTAGGYTNYMLELGPTWISQENKITMSSRWAHTLVFHDEAGTKDLFWSMPIGASRDYPLSEIQRYGYWTTPSNLLGDGTQVVTYTLPLLDENGDAYGVFGFELSLSYLTQEFLPTSELPYQNSFYIVAEMEGEYLYLDWFIPSSSMAQAYLNSGDVIRMRPTSNGDDSLRETSIDPLGDLYCSIHPLQLYSANSPFENVNWALVAFLQKSVLHETSSHVETLLIGSILVTTAVALLGVIILPIWATRKIRGLSKHLRGASTSGGRIQKISIPRTGLGEIDELIHAVERLNRNVISASERISKIMALTDIPIGGFELQNHSDEVFLTEYVYDLLGRDPADTILKQEWEALYAGLTAQPYEEKDVYSYTRPNGVKAWLRIVVSENSSGSVGIVVDVSDDVEEHRRLSHELDFDSMTGLYSRYAFQRIAYSRIDQDPEAIGAMIFADLDNLKFINDNYGHDVGDQYLQLAGQMFSKFKVMGAICARIAGDEFAIYLPGGGQTQAEIRRQILELLKQTKGYTLVTKDGKTHILRFSAGIAWYPRDSRNISELLKLSDYAMYEAKHKRKGTTVEFDPSSYKENAYILENREAINRLLDDELITFHFQPIIDLRSGKVFGYEALMRSLMPEFKSPLEILSVANAQSKMYQLERLVLFKALGYVSENLDEIGDAKVFINSLPSQYLNDKDTALLTSQWPDTLDKIVIEVTEDSTGTITQMKRKVETLRMNGMQIAVDDFGAGYSNELRILSLDPDFVKIDMAIIQGIADDTDKQHLVSSIISFCKQKNILTIAEGVENEKDLIEVVRLGIDMVQGFYTAHPAPTFPNIHSAALETIQKLSQDIEREGVEPIQ